MTPVTVFKGRRVAVFGIGSSGIATCAALKAGGTIVIAFDDQVSGLEDAKAKGIEVRDLRRIDWSSLAALILAPGVPLTHPEPHWSVQLAKAAGVEIIGDVELFCRERRANTKGTPFAAITGTNGKSTTTALLAHVVRSSGLDTQVGGNLGTPILALDPPGGDRVHVIECSSYQIDLAPTLDPTVGILLNLTPDHLDRHGTMENYAAVKERLVAKSGTAIIGVDDDYCRAIAARLEQSGKPVVRISVERSLADGIFLRGTNLVLAERGKEQAIISLAGIGSLRGVHNAQNAGSAFAAARALGVAADKIVAAFKTFPGLRHRLEEVGYKGKVLFVNDSKATNADSTAKALSSFADGVFWIVGGKAKKGGIVPLESFFPKIAHAYLIGESSDLFATTLEGRVPYTRCVTLDMAVTKAAEDATQSDEKQPVVLLSPACASFDQFRNFELRGERFRELVGAIPGFVSKGKTA
jgi:UDP-N-acetylmuramoylalanine--D-glutamate ligase